MQATIVDLRYHMKDILAAVDRNEEVVVLYRGKPKAHLLPLKRIKKKISTLKMKEHPFFGMYKDEKKSVECFIRELRKNRYHAL